MACIHRFANWLQLATHVVDWEVSTLIVGTFNPGWQCNNNAGWFYGRTDNNYLWEVLPALYGVPSLRQPENNAEWLNFCRTHGIAFTDLISVILDADEGNPVHQEVICGNNFSDTAIENNFDDFLWTSVIQVLLERPSIRNVYLTRSSTGIWGERWNMIQDLCEQSERHCRGLLTPSGNARFQYTAEMKAVYPTLSLFIQDRWRQNWHGN